MILLYVREPVSCDGRDEIIEMRSYRLRRVVAHRSRGPHRNDYVNLYKLYSDYITSASMAIHCRTLWQSSVDDKYPRLNLKNFKVTDNQMIISCEFRRSHRIFILLHEMDRRTSISNLNSR